MKSLKKILCLSLALLLLMATAATAQAKSYSVDAGNIYITADEDGHIVEVGTIADGYTETADAAPVLTGSTNEYCVEVDADDGETAELTLNGVTMRSPFISTVDLYPEDGTIILNLKGTNKLIGTSDGGNDGLYISGFLSDQSAVSIRGDGSLTATVAEGTDGAGITVFDAALSVDGGSVTGVAPDGYGVGLYEGSTLSVSEDYLHPASVTAVGGKGSFEMFGDVQVIIGENNFVLDENGRDVTAKVLADPTLLTTMKYVIIATKDIAVFPSDDMSSNVHLMTAYKNTSFEQTGEPSADAMKLLSQGRNGEALYAASFAFTDDIPDHSQFQLNIVLPQYAGKHVTLVTLEDGKAVAYDRWVANNGTVWALVDHLGDFAVFAA